MLYCVLSKDSLAADLSIDMDAADECLHDVICVRTVCIDVTEYSNIVLTLAPCFLNFDSEKTKCEIGETGSERYLKDTILGAFVEVKSQYLSEDIAEPIAEKVVVQVTALSGKVEAHDEEKVLSSYETSSADRDVVGDSDHVAETELLDTVPIGDETDSIEDMKTDPLDRDEISTGETTDDKNGRSHLAREDSEATHDRAYVRDKTEGNRHA